MFRAYCDASFGSEPGGKSMYSVSYDLIPVDKDWHSEMDDVYKDGKMPMDIPFQNTTGHFHTKSVKRIV